MISVRVSDKVDLWDPDLEFRVTEGRWGFLDDDIVGVWYRRAHGQRAHLLLATAATLVW